MANRVRSELHCAEIPASDEKKNNADGEEATHYANVILSLSVPFSLSPVTPLGLWSRHRSRHIVQSAVRAAPMPAVSSVAIVG